MANYYQLYRNFFNISNVFQRNTIILKNSNFKLIPDNYLVSKKNFFFQLQTKKKKSEVQKKKIE